MVGCRNEFCDVLRISLRLLITQHVNSTTAAHKSKPLDPGDVAALDAPVRGPPGYASRLWESGLDFVDRLACLIGRELLTVDSISFSESAKVDAALNEPVSPSPFALVNVFAAGGLYELGASYDSTVRLLLPGRGGGALALGVGARGTAHRSAAVRSRSRGGAGGHAAVPPSACSSAAAAAASPAAAAATPSLRRGGLFHSAEGSPSDAEEGPSALRSAAKSAGGGGGVPCRGGAPRTTS